MAGNFIYRMKMKPSCRVVPEVQVSLPPIQLGRQPSSTHHPPQTSATSGRLSSARGESAVKARFSADEELLAEHTQLVQQNQELCRELEEKRSKIKHLEESLLKLQEENEDLRCRDLQRAGENQELLRENLELKGQLERKAAVIATMVTEHEQLRYKIEKVRNKNLDLIDGRAALLAGFRQQLSREKQMRLDLCKSMKARDQPASESAGGKNAGRDETRQPRKPSFLQYQLKGEWLEASLERVKAKSSGEASQNVLGWLRGSLEGRDGDPSEASRHSLAEWLLASLINIHRGCPEAAREDVRAWLEVSITHLRAEGPEASALTVEDWLQASIAGLAKVEPADAKSPGGPRKGWLERAIETLKEGCGERSPENILKPLRMYLNAFALSEEPRPAIEKWLRQCFLTQLQEAHPGSKPLFVTWLEISKDSLEEEGAEAPQLGTRAWLEASIRGMQGLQRQMSLERSIQQLKQQSDAGAVGEILDWLQDFLKGLSFTEDPPAPLEKWLECCIKNLEKILRMKNKRPKMDSNL